jgi:predicted amidophosphoribosyltransferase
MRGFRKPLGKLVDWYFDSSFMCAKCKEKLRNGRKYCTDCQIKVQSEQGKASRTKRIMKSYE